MKNNSILAQNKKARRNYEIISTLEAGLILTGNEIKSIREGRVSLNQAYVKVINNEVWLIGAHIAPYSRSAKMEEYDPIRTRKLLLNRSQIKSLIGQSQQRSMALVPLKLYFKRNLAKLEIGLGRGRKLYDKRAVIKQREQKREVERELRGKY